MSSEVVELPFAVDLRAVRRGIEGATLGGADPEEVWWAAHTPAGPGSLQLTVFEAGGGHSVVAARGFGPGAGWMVAQAPRLLGAEDAPERFDPPAGLVRDLHRRHPARFGRTDRVFDALLAAIIGQKVAVRVAEDSLRRLTARYGEPAPGPLPGPLRLRPAPSRLAGLSSMELHHVGLERKRADILLRAARAAVRARNFDDLPDQPPVAVERRLRLIDGVGPWTSALVRSAALGDPDAVAVGDFHLPNLVCWALAREPRGDDARMLELLEPFGGHRGRVVRLVRHAGPPAPKRGPRLRLLPLGAYDRPDASLRRDLPFRRTNGAGW